MRRAWYFIFKSRRKAMPQVSTFDLAGAVALVSHPIKTSPEDYDPLLDAIGEARFVLLGEASHGTSEFYRERAAITKRLIEEKGFTAVAAEADWPDSARLNRFVKGGDLLEGTDPLSEFRRFPRWMWRNTEVLDFSIWLRQWNDALERGRAKTGFYGLDLYSMHASAEAVLAYLDRVDPEAALRARDRYNCFDGGASDETRYGYVSALDLDDSCEDEVVAQLVEMQRKSLEYAARAGAGEADDFFDAEQNARLVVDAERYYRTMFMGGISSWNLRDRHMADTLDALEAHLGRTQGRPPKIVAWEHNSHIGDARATDARDQGELNVGQLTRERHSGETYLLGFTTYGGTVMAASEWGAAGEAKRVRPALAESYEALLHNAGAETAGLDAFFLDLRDESEVMRELAAPRLERAIGVVYRPETERASHYFRARLPEQFDGLLHFDHTHAVDPLGPPAERGMDEVPETFPFSV
jgi:erythromycin esterase-like protein